MSFLVLPLTLLMLAGCGEEANVAEPRTAVPIASPTTLAELPNTIEAVEVTVSNGTFSVDQLTLQEDEPSILRVTNKDDTAYRIKIKPDLVTATAVPANKTTDIAFTTPKANTYEGDLLAADSDKVLDTVDVVVQSPGAVNP
jgi:hypothetical protein